jgi:DNA-binding transcriptional LysR family regulator
MQFAASREPWAWEFERGKKTWRVPVRGPVTTNDHELRRVLALSGVGLIYSFEPVIADELARGRLRIVLEAYAATVPGLFLYFPSRMHVSAALRAFVELAREIAAESNGTKSRSRGDTTRA